MDGRPPGCREAPGDRTRRTGRLVRRPPLTCENTVRGGRQSAQSPQLVRGRRRSRPVSGRPSRATDAVGAWAVILVWGTSEGSPPESLCRLEVTSTLEEREGGARGQGPADGWIRAPWSRRTAGHGHRTAPRPGPPAPPGPGGRAGGSVAR